MSRIALFASLCLFCFSTSSIGLEDAVSSIELREHAQQGDAKAQNGLAFDCESGLVVEKDFAEAIRSYCKAAVLGDPDAKLNLARLFFEGIGVKKDYTKAASLYGCPKPSLDILGNCRAIQYKDLPEPAVALLNKLKCNVSHAYNYGSAVDLNGDGISEYQICCYDALQEPCSSVLIGKVGSEWKNLGAGALAAYETACGYFIVLESAQDGFHDICLPNQCSPISARRCIPTIWQFNNGRYRLK